jgi:hypothetical protein
MNYSRIITLSLGLLSAVGNAVLIGSIACEYTTGIVFLIVLLVVIAILLGGFLLDELDPEND